MLAYRLGPRICERNGDAMVHLAEDARNCVVYLGIPGDTPQDFHIEGTGFFISYGTPSERYLVTAAHVAEIFGGGTWGIRYNTVDGQADVLPIDPLEVGEWRLHPDYPRIDVAVLRLSPSDDSDIEPFPSHALATDLKIAEKDLGPGDLAYVVGLFHLLHGRMKNRPFVHTGNIAMHPEGELIPTEEWRKEILDKLSDKDRIPTIDIEGHLLEVHTLPGSSGSPVFARRTIFGMRDDPSSPDSPQVKTWRYGTVWLLGVWHGAWKGRPDDVYNLPPGTIVPIGVGIVSPAERLLEILEGPELTRQRKEKEQTMKREVAVSALTPADETSLT